MENKVKTMKKTIQTQDSNWNQSSITFGRLSPVTGQRCAVSNSFYRHFQSGMPSRHSAVSTSTNALSLRIAKRAWNMKLSGDICLGLLGGIYQSWNQPDQQQHETTETFFFNGLIDLFSCPLQPLIFFTYINHGTTCHRYHRSRWIPILARPSKMGEAIYIQEYSGGSEALSWEWQSTWT